MSIEKEIGQSLERLVESLRKTTEAIGAIEESISKVEGMMKDMIEDVKKDKPDRKI